TQVVERAARPPDDPEHQVSVSVQGGQARITLDAQTGPDDPERHYLNFLTSTATLVDPRGVAQQISLPQTAPGRYAGLAPVDDDGIYQLEVQQTDPSTGAMALQSSGFVVPYSPEYRADGTDETFLSSLVERTGGRLIQEPREALTHDLPSAGG